MKMTEKQKQALSKYAKLIECDWFEFAVDENGNDCVLDKECNKMIELRQGIEELKHYDFDLMYLLLPKKDVVEIVEIDSALYFHYPLIDKMSKVSSSVGRFLKKYPLHIAETLLTHEEQEICCNIFDLAYKTKTIGRHRAIELLKKSLHGIEEMQNKSILDCDLNKELGLTQEEYDYLFKEKNYR